ncbi:MAG: extracellular solute-binding protein [Oscillospiraceae bacterium]|nr:extracellular solute-binding protein [Oscillospiraceae bacterium]
MKKILCVLLAVMMLALLASACSGDSDNSGGATPTPPAGGGSTPDDVTPQAGTAKYTSDGKRIITIGTWYDEYYVSKHTSIFDNPRLSNPEIAQIELDNMRAIEEKYNIVLDYVNLTWEGIQESITTSIFAGAPDCDVYRVDLQFGIPAVLSNLAVSLEDMGLEGTDIFGPQEVLKYLNVNQPQNYLFAGSIVNSIPNYPLAFNMNLIREANLENPQDLWDRGEWTWDKWREYLSALTKDTTGDGAIDVYGWSGYWTNLLENLLFSNGTTVASGPNETLSSTASIEVLDLIYTIYNVERTARPWDQSNWEINNNLYADGRSGFWIGADWIFQEQGGADLPFEIGVVPWPVGPHGGKDTNYHGKTGGNWFFVPRGVDDPRLVYDVMFDWQNWYDYDRSLAEDLEWSQNQYMTERNFDYAFMMSKNTGFDIWNNLGLGDNFSMVPIMDGEKTAAQYAEETRQLVQDALNNYFG